MLISYYLYLIIIPYIGLGKPKVWKTFLLPNTVCFDLFRNVYYWGQLSLVHGYQQREMFRKKGRTVCFRNLTSVVHNFKSKLAEYNNAYYILIGRVNWKYQYKKVCCSNFILRKNCEGWSAIRRPWILNFYDSNKRVTVMLSLWYLLFCGSFNAPPVAVVDRVGLD